VLLWDSAGGTLRASLPHPAPVTGVAWRGSELFTSCADGTVRRWSLPASPATGLPAAVFSVTFSRDGKRLAAGASGQAGLWNVTDPARPQPLGPGMSGDATARPARGAPPPRRWTEQAR
jgi:WD40 repeat protein